MSEKSLASGQVCRLCLTKDQDVHLSEKALKELKYWQIFTNFTQIKYSSYDGLPQSICRMCASQLTNIHIFKERCLVSHEKLMETLGASNVALKEDQEEIEEKYHPEQAHFEFSTVIVKEDVYVESDYEDDRTDHVMEEVKEEPKPEKQQEKVPAANNTGKRNRQKRYKCKQCGVFVESPNKLIRHLRTHLVENQKVQHSAKLGNVFSCKSCGVAFLKINHLRVHVLGGRCKKMPGANLFPTADDAEKTKEEHLKGYKCYMCSKLHDNLKMLKKHLVESHKRPGDPLFSCIRCSFAHEFPDDMILHYRSSKSCDTEARNGEKETHHSCDICGKHFRYQCEVKKHIATHSQEVKEKLFECDICSRRFTRKADVDIHKRAHFNVKPYMCQDCGACFTRSSNLLAHRLSHTGMAKWKCSVCQKRFKRKADLKMHTNSHTGARPFKCRYCSKTYTSNGGLNKHYAHHPDIKRPSRRVEPVCS